MKIDQDIIPYGLEVLTFHMVNLRKGKGLNTCYVNAFCKMSFLPSSLLIHFANICTLSSHYKPTLQRDIAFSSYSLQPVHYANGKIGKHCL